MWPATHPHRCHAPKNAETSARRSSASAIAAAAAEGIWPMVPPLSGCSCTLARLSASVGSGNLQHSNMVRRKDNYRRTGVVVMCLYARLFTGPTHGFWASARQSCSSTSDPTAVAQVLWQLLPHHSRPLWQLLPHLAGKVTSQRRVLLTQSFYFSRPAVVIASACNSIHKTTQRG